MGNLCAGGIGSSHAPTTYDDHVQMTPPRQRPATPTPGQSPLRELGRRPVPPSPGASRLNTPMRTPIGTPMRSPMSSVEQRMLQDIQQMTPEINHLIGVTRGIPPLRAQYDAAVQVQGQIRRRLDGDIRAGGGDDFRRRMGRIRNQVTNYYARHPDAALPPVQRPRGGAAGVSNDVLQTASNMLTGFETVVFHGANGMESLKVLDHLQDIARNREVDPAVIDAARQADNNPAALVANLLALVQQNPPILSSNTRR